MSRLKIYNSNTGLWEYVDTGNETTTTTGTLINGATPKATPIDADQIGLMDSVASNILKKLSWANIKATLKTYFDTLYLGLNEKADTAGAADTAANLVANAEASDHGTAATDQVINVSYGTGAAPEADTTTEGSIYITYTA
jgi:hypothetical protein